MPRIALFGGSFDPPHIGHVLAAVHARSVGGCDAVWILPCARHPWAKDLSPWAQRWALCQAAFLPLGPWCQVRDDELTNPNGYTVDLVEGLLARHPGTEFVLVGGSDTGRQLPTWHRGADLARLVQVHVVPRGGHDPGLGALPEVSSSLVRTLVKSGDPAVVGLLPAAVLAHITAAGWYR